MVYIGFVLWIPDFVCVWDVSGEVVMTVLEGLTRAGGQSLSSRSPPGRLGLDGLLLWLSTPFLGPSSPTVLTAAVQGSWGTGLPLAGIETFRIQCPRPASSLRACLGPAGPRGPCPPPCSGCSENTVEETPLRKALSWGRLRGRPCVPRGSSDGSDLRPPGAPDLGLGPCHSPRARGVCGVPSPEPTRLLGQPPAWLTDVCSLPRLSWGKVLAWQLIKDFN